MTPLPLPAVRKGKRQYDKQFALNQPEPSNENDKQVVSFQK